MSLTSLVYVSFAVCPTREIDLKRILISSRRNNQANNITGMLLYRNGLFIQALEGEQDAVDETFHRITIDTRHQNVLKVYENEIKRRTFCHWVMGFNYVEDDNLTVIDHYADFLVKPDSFCFAPKPDRAQALLQSFRDRTYF